MNESVQRKRGVVLSYVSVLASMLVQLLYTPFLIKTLGQSEYGLYSLVSSIIGYLSILDLGFGNAIVVYTSKYVAQKKFDEEKQLHGMFFIIFTIIGVIATILGFILYFNVENIFQNTMTTIEIKKAKVMMLILTFNLAITFPFSIYSSIITAYEEFTFQKIITILNTLLKPLLMIPLLALGFKSITMTVVITIVNMVVLFSNYFYCRKHLNIKIKYMGINKALFKIIFGYSIWIFLATIVDKVNWSVDQFILGIFCGTTAVSVYSLAVTFNTLFMSLSTAISGVFLPKMSKLIAKNADSTTLSNEFIKVGRLQFYVIFLITTGFLLFGKEFILWWAGKEYLDTYYVALCLVLPAALILIQNVGLSIIQAMNKFKFRAIATTVMSGFNIIISIFLAKKYGAIGAAFGTTIALVLCNLILMNFYYYKEIKIDVPKFWKNIISMAIKYSGALLIIIIILRFNKFSGIASVIFNGIIYVSLYALTSYIFVMNNYEKNLIKSVLLKLRKVKEK